MSRKSGLRPARDGRFNELLSSLLRRVNGDSQPNASVLAARLKDLDAITLNLKFFGFELARKLAEAQPHRPDLGFERAHLTCKPSTQADLESVWAAFWCRELKIPVIFHRKIWEFVFFLQVLGEHGLIGDEHVGLGFGCGEEPLASYLASRGNQVVVTDLADANEAARSWRETNQLLSGPDSAFKEYLVDRSTFDQRVTHRIVDMNAIPPDLKDFDFCWSICALEHLGSISLGMQFVANSLATLKPGGLAVHTTEFNFLNDRETLDNWPTVLPQRKHFEALAARLTAAGHHVYAMDFDIGSKPLDRFIDLPPYPADPTQTLERFGAVGESMHLKLSIDGFASTCFGLIIKKGL